VNARYWLGYAWRAGFLVALVAAGLFVASCAQTGPTQDRGGVNCDNTASTACAPVDETRDVDYVLIERNANDAPNIVVSCVAGMGYTSGSTGRAQGEGGTAGGAQISRDTGWDPLCKLHQKQSVVAAGGR
jgi:hypothetical protein